MSQLNLAGRKQRRQISSVPLWLYSGLQWIRWCSLILQKGHLLYRVYWSKCSCNLGTLRDTTRKWKWSRSVVSNSLRHHGLYIAHQAPLSMGFSGQEYWSGSLFPSPNVIWEHSERHNQKWCLIWGSYDQVKMRPKKKKKEKKLTITAWSVLTGWYGFGNPNSSNQLYLHFWENM